MTIGTDQHGLLVLSLIVRDVMVPIKQTVLSVQRMISTGTLLIPTLWCVKRLVVIQKTLGNWHVMMEILHPMMGVMLIVLWKMDGAVLEVMLLLLKMMYVQRSVEMVLIPM